MTSERAAAATVENVKAFLRRQPHCGMFLVVPGEWEAWLKYHGPDRRSHVHISGPPCDEGRHVWPDLARGHLRNRDYAPKTRHRVRYYVMDLMTPHKLVWEALEGLVQQHQRWTVARDVWMRAVIS